MEDKGKILILITLFGIGTLKGYVIRHLAPLSADALLNHLPLVLRGRFSFGSKKYWSLPGIGIRKGLNSKTARTEVEAGEIVYYPKSDELIFCIETLEMPDKVNIIGKIQDDLSLLLKAKNGLNTKISREK
ncbi:MAG: cyclophilin-like fold protein [Promethearchaeota archaeon]